MEAPPGQQTSHLEFKRGSNGVLVVCAHPDDAELMLGGSIAGWCAAGVRVTVACVATSETSPQTRGARRRAAARASAILGCDLEWLAEESLVQVEDLKQYELVRRVDAIVEALRPSVLIGHWEGDSHFDHRLCAVAVAAASRRYPVSVYEFGVAEMRTHRQAGFIPTLWMDITPTAPQKYLALAEYDYPGQGFRRLDIDAVRLTDRYNGLHIGAEAAECLRQVRGVAGSGDLLIHPLFPGT